MKSRGFTLIELLVVIAIIGLLASIVVASLSSVQANGRDARRIADVDQIRKAMALYASSNGSYPIETSTSTLTSTTTPGSLLVSAGFMSSIPSDPGTQPNYVYRSNASGSSYWIGFCLETDTIRGYATGCENYLTP